MIEYHIVLFSVVCGALAFPQVNYTTQLDIVGGNVTDITKVPYMAASLRSCITLECAASIISKQYLLTAAHCCAQPHPLTYRIGSSYYGKGGMVVKGSQFFIHPKYSNKAYPIYDVCIVKMMNPITLKRTMQPIQIATRLPHPGDLVQVAGWGVTETGEVSSVLRSVLVPVVSENKCSREYPEIKDMSAVICAGAQGKDSCQGDSGGALTYNHKLLGIVSFGFGCGLKGYPGIYANVLNPDIRNFIRSVAGV